MEGLCQGVVSQWYTSSPRWGAHILFVGMLKLQENLKFDNYNAEAGAKPRAIRLREYY